MPISDPPVPTPEDLERFLRLLVPVAGTLSGLVFTGMIFWMQSAIRNLQYVREPILDLINYLAQVILYTLVFVAVTSLLMIGGLNKLTFASFLVFGIVSMVANFRFTAHAGLLVTYSSRNFIPAHYGPTRQFLRKITNAGWQLGLRLLIVLGGTVGYPFYLSRSAIDNGELSDAALFYAVLFAVVLAFAQLPSLIFEAVSAERRFVRARDDASRLRQRQLQEPTEPGWSEKRMEIQRDILLQALSGALDTDVTSMGLPSKQIKRATMMHPPRVNPNATAHVNVLIPFTADRQRLRDATYSTALSTFEAVMKSPTDVTEVAVSLWLDHDNLAFFRATFDKLSDAFPSKTDARSKLAALKTKLVSDVIADDI